MMKITDLSHLFKWENLHNWWLTKYFFAPLYVKIHTPEVIAYHDNNEQLYLAPNLKMGTLTKDIHSLYPSKPCVRDNTKGTCGLELL